MNNGDKVFAWNEGDIERKAGTYRHKGSVKHWVNVQGKLQSFDYISDPPPETITIKQAEKIIFEFTGKRKQII